MGSRHSLSTCFELSGSSSSGDYLNRLIDVLGKSRVTTNITKSLSLAKVTSEHSDMTAVP